MNEIQNLPKKNNKKSTAKPHPNRLQIVKKKKIAGINTSFNCFYRVMKIVYLLYIKKRV